VTDLVFDCIDVQADPYAAAPTLLFKIRISETSGQKIHGIALRCQLRVEPQRRRYSPREEAALSDLFGDTARWGDTLRPFNLAFAAQMVPSFVGSTEIDLPVAFTYDFEVTASKYLHSLDDGEIPLLLLFSGSVFAKGERGLSVDQVPWHKEDEYRLPVAVWDRMMDIYFPDAAWIRMSRSKFDALHRFRSERMLLSWDDTIEVLLKEAGGDT
jgi:hypothetical protein